MTMDREGGLREQILHHATRLFAIRGFAGTSMRELTEACNCTKAACYYYYSNKEALYREVVSYHQERVEALIRSTLAGKGSVRERLHEGLEAMIKYCIQEPMATRLMQRIDLAPEDTAPVLSNCVSRDKHLVSIVELVRLGIESGELREDMNVLDSALILAGSMHFQFEQAITSGTWERERMHTTIDLIFDGIANHD